MTNTFETIQYQINSLQVSFCEDETMSDILVELYDQLNFAMSAEHTREYLSEFIKTDNDVLDCGYIADNTMLYEDIRNIQDQIINRFGV